MSPTVARALVFLVVNLLLCGGCAGGSGSSCHDVSQCASMLSCVGPDDFHGCGVAPRRECASDTDCQNGMVCNAIYDGCSDSGVGSQCGVKCGPCDPGFRCNAGGACEPVPCDQGFSCPSYQRCDTTAAHAAGPVYQRTQGCVNIACSDDSGCPAGKACVNSYCQDGPGSCMKVLAVP
jgi:hypothetical protein